MHLFTFEGNMGDIFVWSSIQSLLSEALQTNIEFRNVEIREFYRNSQKRYFDAKFLTEINECDLLIIGGGAFFDVRWDYSHTGTTLNFSDEFIEGIQIPVIIMGLGYLEPGNTDEGNSVQKCIFNKFERFIRNVSERKSWFLSIRNDGSMERITVRFGAEFATLFKEIPDNGFYFHKNISSHEFDEKKRHTIGFQIANTSFTADDAVIAGLKELYDSIAKVVKILVEQDNRVVFFLHMPSDIDAVSKILQCIGVEGFRRNVVLAPYNPAGVNAAKEIVSYYKACDVVVAMRFHANVIALENIIPTVGLISLGVVSGERIAALYQKLGLGEYVLQTGGEDDCLDERILHLLSQLLSNPQKCIDLETRAMTKIMQQRNDYCESLRTFYLQQKNVGANDTILGAKHI